MTNRISKNIFKNKGLPDEVEEVTLSKKGGSQPLVDLLVELSLVPSKSEARRLIRQNAVQVNGERVKGEDAALDPGKYLLKVGKRRFKRVTFS